MNGDRPTISALQKAGRIAEKRANQVTPQDDEDHEVLAAQWEAELAAGSSRSVGDTVGVVIERPLSEDETIEVEVCEHVVKTPTKSSLSKVKGNGKAIVLPIRKRKVRFDDEEVNQEVEAGPILRSGRLSKRTKRV